MNMKSIYGLILIILFSSCMNNKDVRNNVQLSQFVFDIDEYISTIAPFEVEHIKKIPLETNDYSLLGDIRKIIYRNNKFFIMDNFQTSIHIFAKDGKFISKLHRQGAGPNEYIEITDFDVDDNENVYVSCGHTHKIIKYIYPNYREAIEWSIPFPFLELAVDSKTGNIWIANILSYDGCIPLTLFVNGQIETIIGSRGFLDELQRGFKKQSFYRSGGEIFFNPRFSPTIYHISGEEVAEFLRFESKNIVNERNFPASLGNRTDRISNAIIYGVNSFYKLNDVYYGTIWSSAMRTPLFKYDKKSNLGVLMDPFESSGIRFFSGIYTATSEALILVMPADVDSDDNPYLVKVVPKKKW